MRHPEAVAGMVLVDPAIEWLTPDPQRAYRLRRARFRMAGFVIALGETGSNDDIKDVLSTALHDPTLDVAYPLTDGRLVTSVELDADGDGVVGADAGLRARRGGDMSDLGLHHL